MLSLAILISLLDSTLASRQADCSLNPLEAPRPILQATSPACSPVIEDTRPVPHSDPSDPSIDSDDDRFYAFLYNEGCTEDVQRVFVKKYKSYLEGDKLAKTVVNQPPDIKPYTVEEFLFLVNDNCCNNSEVVWSAEASWFCEGIYPCLLCADEYNVTKKAEGENATDPVEQPVHTVAAAADQPSDRASNKHEKHPSTAAPSPVEATNQKQNQRQSKPQQQQQEQMPQQQKALPVSESKFMLQQILAILCLGIYLRFVLIKRPGAYLRFVLSKLPDADLWLLRLRWTKVATFFGLTIEKMGRASCENIEVNASNHDNNNKERRKNSNSNNCNQKRQQQNKDKEALEQLRKQLASKEQEIRKLQANVARVVKEKAKLEEELNVLQANVARVVKEKAELEEEVNVLLVEKSTAVKEEAARRELLVGDYITRVSKNELMQLSEQLALLQARIPKEQARREDLARKRAASKAEQAIWEKTCVVCLEKPFGVVFLPCKHMKTCEGCSESLTNCPLCRAPIESKFVPFL